MREKNDKRLYGMERKSSEERKLDMKAISFVY